MYREGTSLISNSTNLSVNKKSDGNINHKKSTSFKGVETLLANVPGQVMNGIEQGGFVTSFLVQDTLGMTGPRAGEGLYRDREKKTKFKDLNFKEGVEVFVREFFSGVLLMFTPFAVFALTKKHIGKSSFTNTSLLKELGKQFTKTVKNKETTETIKTMKNKFYKDTITTLVEHTTPKAKGSEQANNLIDTLVGHANKIDELEEQLSNNKTGKKEIKKQIKELKGTITKHFNDFHTSNSDNLTLVNRVKLNGKTFDSSNTIEAMRGYAHDVAKSKNIEDLNEETAKQFEKTSMGKRIFSTIAASLGAIGAISLVPKFYSLINPVAPSIGQNIPQTTKTEKTTPSETQTATISKDSNNKNKKGSNIAFKGNVLNNLQFNGNQLTPLLMTTLAAFGLLTPRVATAVKRAPVDEDTGKKNLIEVPEIIARDIPSTLACTFGVPMLSKFMVHSYEGISGFVLSKKPKTKLTAFQRVIDMLNPISPVGPYNNKDIKEIYGNVNSKEKLTNFASFIDKHDGNLVKVLKNLHNAKDVFKGTEADFENLVGLDKRASNKKIIKVIKETFNEETITRLLAPKKAGKVGKANEMLLKARTLNSLPSFLSTLILIPLFLGVILPKFVYSITAKNRKKIEENKQKIKAMKSQSTVQTTAQKTEPVKKNSDLTFERLKHTT